MTSPAPSRARALAVATLLAALLQTLCVVNLNTLAPERASAEPDTQLPFLLALGGLLLLFLVSFSSKLAARWPVLLGVGVVAGLTIAICVRHIGMPAFLVRLEGFTVHATALLAAATWASMGRFAWQVHRRSRAIRVGLGVSGLGTLALLGIHVGTSLQSSLMYALPAMAIGLPSAMALLIVPLGVAAAWRADGARSIAIAGTAVAACVLARIILAADLTIIGGHIAAPRVPYMGAVLVASALVISVTLRPTLERWVSGLIAIISIFAVSLGWLTYSQGYGSYEDSYGPIIRSFLGFSLPYPAYVPHWRAIAAMVGAFFAISTVYASLVSPGSRDRGVALALMMAAGLGFASPHLLLAFTAGAALLLLAPPSSPDESSTLPPDAEDPGDLEASIQRVAERLDLGPVIIADTLLAIEDEMDGVKLRVRTRRSKRSTALHLIAGLEGRAQPALTLLPKPTPSPSNAGGHPIHRTHRLQGDARILEAQPQFLDALSRFPRAHASVWTSGIAVRIHDPRETSDTDGLEALIRAMVRTQQFLVGTSPIAASGPHGQAAAPEDRY